MKNSVKNVNFTIKTHCFQPLYIIIKNLNILPQFTIHNNNISQRGCYPNYSKIAFGTMSNWLNAIRPDKTFYAFDQYTV